MQPVAEQGQRQAGSMVPALSQCEMPEQILWPDGSTKSATKTRVRGARLALVLLWVLAPQHLDGRYMRSCRSKTPTYLQLVVLASQHCLLCLGSDWFGERANRLHFAPHVSQRRHDRAASRRVRCRTSGRHFCFPSIERTRPRSLPRSTPCVGNSRQSMQVSDFDVFILSDTQGRLTIDCLSVACTRIYVCVHEDKHPNLRSLADP